MLKKFAIVMTLAGAAWPAAAKEVPAAVAKAQVARDQARRAVLSAQVALAKARAALAESQLALTQAKYDAGMPAKEAEAE